MTEVQKLNAAKSIVQLSLSHRFDRLETMEAIQLKQDVIALIDSLVTVALSIGVIAGSSPIAGTRNK